MNKFASFSFKDADSINKLMERYPLAAGTNVFTSEGKLLVQYQDGQDDPAPVKVIEHREKILKFEAEKAIIKQSQHVLDTLIADAKSRVDVTQAEVTRLEATIEDTTANPTKKRLKDELELAEKTLKEAKAGLHEVKSQKLLNEHEMGRHDLNIEYEEAQIAELEKEPA